METEILITKYFYPLPQNGTEKFFGGIYFDNPRTKEEIKYVADYLKKINYSSNRPFPEKSSQVPSNCITLWWIIENIHKNNNSDINVLNYYKNAKQLKNIYYALAKMWIIVRCDSLIDETALDKLFFISTKEIPLITETTLPPNNVLSYDKIKKLLLFLSFMTSTKGNINHSILLNDYYGIEEDPKFHNFFPFILSTCTVNKTDKKHELKPPFVTFNILFDFYKKYIDIIKENYIDHKFLFICDTIANISDLELKNPKMYLLGIVGLIEMLLTHNPDTSMYNIEDSISKQYVRKFKYVLYKRNNSINLETLEKELKLSYQVRSDIAHGNFGKTSIKNLTSLLAFYDLKLGGKGFDYVELEDGISYLNSNLTEYTKVLLEMYLTNPKELDLIKDL